MPRLITSQSAIHILNKVWRKYIITTHKTINITLNGLQYNTNRSDEVILKATILYNIKILLLYLYVFTFPTIIFLR